MLTLVEGQAGAFVRVLFRLRLFLLLFLLAAAIVAGPLPAFHLLQTDDVLPAIVTLFLALALAYVHLRHAGLSFLVAVSPLCGLALALGVDDFVLRQGICVLGYIGGVAAGLCIADALSGTVATGVHRTDAARAAFAAHIPPLLAAMFFATAPAIYLFLRDGIALPAIITTLCLALPSFTTLLIVPMAGSLFRYGENYLERASRLHERRQHRAEYFTVLAEPRWSLSFSGILLVIVVLFWSGAPQSGYAWQGLAAVLGLLGIAAIVTTLRWRAAIAIFISVPIAASAGLAIAQRLSLPVPAVMDLILEASVLAFLFAALIGWRFRLGEKDGDDTDAARIRAIAQLAPPLLMSALLSLLIMMSWYGRVNLLVLLAVLLAGHVAALFTVPALSGALETVIRRRQSLESLYRG